MNFEYKGKQDAEYSACTVDADVVTIGGETFDLGSLQTDEQKIIDVKENSRYLANIFIPPAEYDYIETGETDIDGNKIFEKTRKPVNQEKVKIILWEKKPINNNTEGGI